jgi:hypothetical protein
MNQPTEHERIVEILTAARRPEGETTQETLEENLRWLVHEAVPQDKASEALRQRVQAMTAAHRTRPRPLLTRLVDFLIRNRSPLLGAASAAAFAIGFFLLLTQPTPADVLGRALDAMAQVRSAHCTGWVTTYRRKTPGGPDTPLRTNVEWWYKWPEHYRQDRSGVESEGYMPYRLIVQGPRGQLFVHHGLSVGTTTEIRDDELTQYLSPLDFFSPEGIIRRAQREGRAQPINRKGRYHGRPVNIVELNVLQQTGTGTSRQYWVLTVDPSSNRILQSESRLDLRGADVRKAREEETLNVFEYNVDVNDDLFQAELFSQPLPPASANLSR